jgi:hypothetical protein
LPYHDSYREHLTWRRIMNTQSPTTVFGEVLGELMRSRGIPEEPESFAELAEKSGLDLPTFRARIGGDVDADLVDLWGLAQELGLSRQEMRLLARAYTYEKGRRGDVRAELLGNIVTHLDYVACLEEAQHDGTDASRYIRRALIPYCEVQEALALETED